MIDTQKIKQKAQIERFKNKFYRDHDIKLFILTPTSSKSSLTLTKYKGQNTLKIKQKSD